MTEYTLHYAGDTFKLALKRRRRFRKPYVWLLWVPGWWWRSRSQG